MKALTISAALSCAALCLFAATNRFTHADLTVHEWGTFTSVAASDGAPAEWNTLGCKDDLPSFVNDFGYRGFKFRLGGTVRMETPVLYFYSPNELNARVKVSFPNGLLTEWYPQADNQIFAKKSATGEMLPLPGNLSGINASLMNQTGVLEWKSVKILPAGDYAFPSEKGASRYYAARATDSAPLQVGTEHEKFLFYRGVARIPVPLVAKVGDDGKITVQNKGTDAVPSVILFENRAGSIGYRNAGHLATSLTLERPVLNATSRQLKTDLQAALISNGLYPKEAAAMIDTWHDSWFEEGSRLIYILPESAVNSMLPIEIDPAPARIERVFVGRIELITPETRQIVSKAIENNDKRTLALYQRFIDPISKNIGKPANLPPCQTAEGR
jgi:hypothetical protein